MKNKNIKLFIKIAGRILVILSVIFVAYKIYKLGFDLSVVEDVPKFTGMSLIALVFNMLSTLVLALAWGRWISFFSKSKVNKLDAVTIYGKSAIGKYLPGNIMHYVERNLFAAEYGLSQKKIALSTVMEIVGMIVSSVLLSIILLPTSDKLKISETLGFDLGLVGLTAVIVVALIIVFGVLLIRKTGLYNVLKEYKFSDFIVSFLLALLAGIACLLLNGGGMVALWIGLQDIVPGISDMRHILSSFSAAWVCGFVLPGAPGGIGVREAVLTVLLEDMVAGQILVFLIIAHRIICIIGDFAFFAMVSLHKKAPQNANEV